MTEHTPTATVTLEQRTARIKFHLERGNRILNEAATAATIEFIEAGKELIEAKRQLQHGQWQGWLADNFRLGVDTAQNLMRVAKRFGSAKTETSRFFNFSQLLILAKLTDDELQAFLAATESNGNNPAALSVRDLREAVKRWRKSHPQTFPRNHGNVLQLERVRGFQLMLYCQTLLRFLDNVRRARRPSRALQRKLEHFERSD